jgi:alpha-1,2-mannosyltransferase
MSPWSSHASWAIGAVLAVPALMLMLRCRRRGRDVSALCVTACFGLLLAPISWVPDWVWIAPIVVALFSWLQATWRGCGPRRAAKWERWASAGAVIAVIAVFTNPYTVPISQQRHRTLGSFWFFVLSNPYVLTAIAIALVLGAGWLRSAGSSPIGGTGDGHGHRQAYPTPISVRTDLSQADGR